jgi:hypothetical protein
MNDSSGPGCAPSTAADYSRAVQSMYQVERLQAHSAAVPQPRRMRMSRYRLQLRSKPFWSGYRMTRAGCLAVWPVHCPGTASSPIGSSEGPARACTFRCLQTCHGMRTPGWAVKRLLFVLFGALERSFISCCNTTATELQREDAWHCGVRTRMA